MSYLIISLVKTRTTPCWSLLRGWRRWDFLHGEFYFPRCRTHQKCCWRPFQFFETRVSQVEHLHDGRLGVSIEWINIGNGDSDIAWWFFRLRHAIERQYIDLAGKIKQNQVFSCSGDDLTSVLIYLHRSNLDDHTTTTHKVSKRLRKFNSVAEVRDYSSSRLKPLKNVRMNPYKIRV